MGKHHNTTKAFTNTERDTAHTVNVHTTVPLPQRQTLTELDDDVGGRKRRRTRTKTDEDEDRRTLGWSKAAALHQLTTTPE